MPEKPTAHGRVTSVGAAPAGALTPAAERSVTSFIVSVKVSPVAGLSTSTAQASVPAVPVRGSSRLNIASSIGVGPPSASAPSCSQRQRITAAVAATTPGNRRFSPVGGNGMSNARSSATVASTSSFSLSHCGSLTRMSIDSVFARADSPRGCSAPLTQTSNGTLCANSPKPGPACAGISPTNSANSPCGWRIMYVHDGLPPFISGRPGQRSELITAVDGRSSVRRRSAALVG